MLKDRFSTYLKWMYLGAFLLSVFSGFGNMPIYGRYYVSDVPGLGWSGNFYMNLYVHYLSGAVLLAVSTLFIFLYVRRRGQGTRLTPSGIGRVLLLGLVLVSGVLAAVKNLPAVNLSQAGLMVTAFVHLGAVMFYLFLSLGCKVLKRNWLADT